MPPGCLLSYHHRQLYPLSADAADADQRCAARPNSVTARRAAITSTLRARCQTMNRNDDADPVEPLNIWPRHVPPPQEPVTEAARVTRALRYLRLLLLTVAILAAVLSFATALADLARP